MAHSLRIYSVRHKSFSQASQPVNVLGGDSVVDSANSKILRADTNNAFKSLELSDIHDHDFGNVYALDMVSREGQTTDVATADCIVLPPGRHPPARNAHAPGDAPTQEHCQGSDGAEARSSLVLDVAEWL
jgi:hypothetical protein